jgi:hypothetical protein
MLLHEIEEAFTVNHLPKAIHDGFMESFMQIQKSELSTEVEVIAPY